MAYKGQVPVRSTIVIDNTILEQMNTFTYLGCKISYEKRKGITLKINDFVQVLGILNNVLKPNLT
jgi:hypothetical protein